MREYCGTLTQTLTQSTALVNHKAKYEAFLLRRTEEESTVSDAATARARQTLSSGVLRLRCRSQTLSRDRGRTWEALSSTKRCYC
ncbi:hypothetical protein SRHO_G00257010 [Serrasalmus rhombeus]